MRQLQGLFVGILFLVVTIAGCGGQSDTPSTSSGTGGTGDAGGMAGGSGGAMPGDAGGMSSPMPGGMMGDPNMMGGAPGGMGGQPSQPAQPAPDEKQISEQRKAEAARSIQEGDRLLAQGDFDGAINEYEIALVDDPDNPSIRTKIERAKAIKAETKRRAVSKLVARGKSLYYQGEYVHAASTLEQALQQDPTHPQALAYLVASGVAIKNLQNHGWPQPGLGQTGDQGGGQVGGGAEGMPGMAGGGMGPSGGMGLSGGMPGMSGGGGAVPGMGGGSSGGGGKMREG